jgi:hypothetical protein
MNFPLLPFSSLIFTLLRKNIDKLLSNEILLANDTGHHISGKE